MVPMRSLPFRLVCLLGLDDGALPRRTPAAGFDLISQHPRRGDRARRLDDRYLLLEILLSARDALYLSYVGRDPRNNAELPPSVLISEVLESVDLTAYAVRRSGFSRDAVDPEASLLQEPASKHLTIAHPLQPFAPGNFAGGAQRSYAASWFRAAQRLAEPPQSSPAAFAGRLPEPGADWLHIEPSQLLQCFRHPARFLLEQRLGLRLADADEALASDEPFALEGPAWRGLRQLALEAVERDWSPEQERNVARAAGWLPTGELGQALWGKLRGPVRAFAPRLFEARPEEQAQPLLVDVQLGGVHIHGWLEGVTSSGLFEWRLNAPSAWDLPAFWLRHLLLNLSATPAIARESLLISPVQDWQLGLLVNPRELLLPWLEAYREALCEPLPLMLKSSYGFAEGLLKPGRKEPIEAARYKAQVAWEGADFSPLPGESQDPWYALAFRDREVLGERFETLAQELIVPALQALAPAAEDEE
jgi:exodeoxyribonuclease V gamma subunit